MPRTVNCVKLGKELPGLPHAPMRGALGARIYDHVSQEAWTAWVKHSTMVINEYRLNPAEPEAQATLRKQLLAYLFGAGAEAPEGYTPPT